MGSSASSSDDEITKLDAQDYHAYDFRKQKKHQEAYIARLQEQFPTIDVRAIIERRPESSSSELSTDEENLDYMAIALLNSISPDALEDLTPEGRQLYDKAKEIAERIQQKNMDAEINEAQESDIEIDQAEEAGE